MTAKKTVTNTQAETQNNPMLALASALVFGADKTIEYQERVFRKRH